MGQDLGLWNQEAIIVSWSRYQNKVVKLKWNFKGRVESVTTITELGHLQGKDSLNARSN